MDHYHIAAGRRVTFDASRPGVSAPGHEGRPETYCTGAQIPKPTTVFVTKAGWPATACDTVSVIHLMKMEQLFMDNAASGAVAKASEGDGSVSVADLKPAVFIGSSSEGLPIADCNAVRRTDRRRTA
jgi:hypothetical protein